MPSYDHAFTSKRIVYYSILVLALCAIALPARLAHADPGESVGQVRQAYFFRPTGQSTQEVMNNADVLFYGLQDVKVVRELKNKGYTKPALIYFLAGELEGPRDARNANEPCKDTTVPWRNNLTYEPNIFCREIHPNEDWFLHNGKGERIYSYQSGYGGVHTYYFMDIGKPAVQEWLSNRLAMTMQGDARVFDGVFLDNVELSLEKVIGQTENSDGTVREYNNDAAYRSAWVAYLKQLSDKLRPGVKIWGNMICDTYTGSDWDAYMDYLDGGLAEAFAAGWPNSRFSTARWNRNLEQLSKALSRGKSVVGVTQGDPGSNALLSFGLGSYLLIAQADRTFYRFSHYADYGNWYQDNTFSVDLGNPLGERYQQSNNTWRRDFERGYVVVDPTKRTAQIVNQTTSESTTPPVIPQPTVTTAAIYQQLLPLLQQTQP